LLPLFDDYPDDVAEALRTRAPVDLRVNLLKTDRAGAIAALAREGIIAEPVDLSSTAFRVTDGARKVAQSDAYKTGLVEIQDAASQAVIDMIDPRPGEAVLDLCAGAGGKTLAMAARMGGRGRFLAHDIAPARMADLGPRASRAGVEVETVPTAALEGLAGTVDLVLVDAPCSGSGAWRRNPDAKWRLTETELDRLVATQAALIDQAVHLMAPAGRIAYITCSVLAPENGDQIAQAKARHPALTLLETRQITPVDGGDGFFYGTFNRIDQG
jgi:16S rRNA (cytosine967-C5)-methyltransferase